MPSGIKGSCYQPRYDTEIRLARWKRLAGRGWPVDDIAAELGISRHALEQMVVRARRHGHPDAICHPHAGSPVGQGVADLIRNSGRRARRIRARALRNGAAT